MAGIVLKFERPVNGVVIEQRIEDGFINATAMAVAHGKNLTEWFRAKDTIEIFRAGAEYNGLPFNHGNSHDSDLARLSAFELADIFPGLITVRRGAPINGGGTWLHPDVAVPCAWWCNKSFAIQVSRWVQEWMVSGNNPVSPAVAEEWSNFYPPVIFAPHCEHFLIITGPNISFRTLAILRLSS